MAEESHVARWQDPVTKSFHFEGLVTLEDMQRARSRLRRRGHTAAVAKRLRVDLRAHERKETVRMIPLKQRFRHDPDNGVTGDCHRAAIASVLELSLDEVPHIMDGMPSAEVAQERNDAFVATLGLVMIDFPFPGGDDPVEGLRIVLHNMAVCNRDVYYLLGGTSKNGCGHTVVCLNNDIVHDPVIDGSGIVGPMEDGFYWVTFFGTRRVKRAP